MKMSKKFAVLTILCSLLISNAGNVEMVNGAAKPKLLTKKVTIIEGSSKKVKIKNAKKVTWKIKTGKTNILLLKKNAKGAVIKGEKSGKAKISVVMKNGKKTTKGIINVTVKAPNHNEKPAPVITTMVPIVMPTVEPTDEPTEVPTVEPTVDPTVAPTVEPTATPTQLPTQAPTKAPTATPTVAPTATPTVVPTAIPTAIPTAVPTAAPEGIAATFDIDYETKSLICTNPDVATYAIIPNGVNIIGNNAFKNCKKIYLIIIPESVKGIEDSAFYGCSSLTSITLPESVTSIGDRAFYNCSSLTSINIPEADKRNR